MAHQRWHVASEWTCLDNLYADSDAMPMYYYNKYGYAKLNNNTV